MRIPSDKEVADILHAIEQANQRRSRARHTDIIMRACGEVRQTSSRAENGRRSHPVRPREDELWDNFIPLNVTYHIVDAPGDKLFLLVIRK